MVSLCAIESANLPVTWCHYVL